MSPLLLLQTEHQQVVVQTSLWMFPSSGRPVRAVVTHINLLFSLLLEIFWNNQRLTCVFSPSVWASSWQSFSAALNPWFGWSHWRWSTQRIVSQHAARLHWRLTNTHIKSHVKSCYKWLLIIFLICCLVLVVIFLFCFTHNPLFFLLSMFYQCLFLSLYCWIFSSEDQ